ncbi:hypothetical protein HDE_10657 [Halotydeus destructor]|nr:hypothetical protein HDE_10657 [Halotydeus destructor]
MKVSIITIVLFIPLFSFCVAFSEQSCSSDDDCNFRETKLTCTAQGSASVCQCSHGYRYFENLNKCGRNVKSCAYSDECPEDMECSDGKCTESEGCGLFNCIPVVAYWVLAASFFAILGLAFVVLRKRSKPIYQDDVEQSKDLIVPSQHIPILSESRPIVSRTSSDTSVYLSANSTSSGSSDYQSISESLVVNTNP